MGIPYTQRVGEKHNMLTILRITGKESTGKRTKIRCLVRCDCGNEKDVRIEGVVNGQQYSCGCNRKKNENSAFRKVFTNYMNSARNRGFSFELDEHQFKAVTSGSCCYCGREGTLIKEAFGDKYVYNGIDRIDSSKGYEISNVVACCTICNRAKMDMDFLEFWVWLEEVSAHVGKRIE